MEFTFDQNKNKLLFEERGVSFYQAIELIAKNGILANINHPNPDKYPDQKMLIINIDGYAYCIPYRIKGNKIFLITIFPNRKFKYLIEGDKNE